MSPGQGPANPADRWARQWGWLIIAAAVLAVYWPLATFAYGMAYGDALDCWMPWRWFITSALRDGHFPLWNPYAQGGYPIYADLQGPAWYPLSIALGGTVGHSAYLLQALFLGYVVMGGIGMMRLLRLLHPDGRTGLVIGLAYALCGFFTAHQMHVYAVISAAWLPWLLAAHLRLLERPGWRPAVEAAIFQALLLTGGNHTFMLIGIWLLLALYAAYGVRAWRRGDRRYIRQMLANGALLAALTALMACGTLFAWAEVAPFIDRAKGMSYADAAKNPFTFNGLLSWLFPYAVGTDAAWLGTDPTMANGYMGVLVLLLAVLSPFRKLTLAEWVIGAFGLLCLLASFGAALPVHRMLWTVVPGLNLFRFPSYYLWFTALAACVLAGGTLAHWRQLAVARPAVVKAAIILAALLVLGLVGRAWFMRVHEPPFTLGEGLFAGITGGWRWHRVLLSAPPVLAALAMMWWWAKAGKPGWGLLLLAVAVEMGWATTLAQWNTALADYSPAALQARIDLQPQGPVWPEMRPMGRNTDGSATLKYIWRNVQDFEGKPSHDGFNSFWLAEANRMDTDHPALFAAMKRQPLVYFADRVVPAGAYDPKAVNPARDSGLVVLQAHQAVSGMWPKTPGDSLWVTDFQHDGITLQTRTAGAVLAVLQQAWYPGWTAFVDGKPTELLRANFAFQGVVLPAGDHRLEFRFTKPVAKGLLGLSLLSFLGCLGLLAMARAASPSTMVFRTGVLVLAGLLGWSLFAHRPKAQRLPREVADLLGKLGATGQAAAPTIVNTGRYPALRQAFQGREAISLRAGEADRLPGVLHATRAMEGRPCWWVDAGLPVAPAIRAALLQRYQAGPVLHAGDVQAVLLRPGPGALVAEELHREMPRPEQWLDREMPWTAAWRQPVDPLMGKGWLLVITRFRPVGAARPTLVIEQRRQGAITDYEAVPLGPIAAGDSFQEAWVARNLAELRHPGRELGIYLWNDGPDSVQVLGFSVLRTSMDLTKWY